MYSQMQYNDLLLCDMVQPSLINRNNNMQVFLCMFDASSVCILCMYSVYATLVCVLCMYSLYAFCITMTGMKLGVGRVNCLWQTDDCGSSATSQSAAAICRGDDSVLWRFWSEDH